MRNPSLPFDGLTILRFPGSLFDESSEIKSQTHTVRSTLEWPVQLRSGLVYLSLGT